MIGAATTQNGRSLFRVGYYYDACMRGRRARTFVTYVRTRGRYLSTRVVSAYYTPPSKSRRSLTLYNVFLRLRRKKALDREKILIDLIGFIGVFI
jgi:hypothetical protein